MTHGGWEDRRRMYMEAGTKRSELMQQVNVLGLRQGKREAALMPSMDAQAMMRKGRGGQGLSPC